jgi:hypothetical protein
MQTLNIDIIDIFSKSVEYALGWLAAIFAAIF